MSIVTEYLTDRDIDFTTFDHARSTTSLAEARSLGIDADDVAKTIVLDTRWGHALAVVPASRRLDMKRARAAVDDPHARLAPETEIAEDFPGYELGALPPLASLLAARTVIDEDLANRGSIVFASGFQTESVQMQVVDLLRDPNVAVAPLAEPRSDDEMG